MSLLLRNLANNSNIKFTNIGKVLPLYYSNNPDPRIPKNALKDLITADNQKENGTVYDKRPFKITLEAGKKYSWCLCGNSKNQPFCDGTHRNIYLKITLKPIRFMVEEPKDYWLCNCKHTKNRPFCDGTHKSKEVQDKTSTIRS